MTARTDGYLVRAAPSVHHGCWGTEIGQVPTFLSEKREENQLNVTNSDTGLAQPDTGEEKDGEIAVAATTVLVAAFIITLLAPLVAYAFF